MRYHLSTLLMLLTIGPPLIGLLWHAWWVVLSFVLVIVVGTAYVGISFWLARLFARFVASMMG